MSNEKDELESTLGGLALPGQAFDAERTMIGRYTLAQIARMRREGLPKPPDLTRAQWYTPLGIKPRTSKIIWMAAQGVPASVIASEVEMSRVRVQQILKSSRIAVEVQKIQYKIYGLNPQKRFMSLLPRAIQTAEEVMSNPAEKGATRLAAASTIMDRALGKPTQSMEINDKSSIKQLFEMLDKRAAAGQAKPGESAEEIVAEFTEVREHQDIPIVDLRREPESNTADALHLKNTNPNDSVPHSPSNPNFEVTEYDDWISQNLT